MFHLVFRYRTALILFLFIFWIFAFTKESCANPLQGKERGIDVIPFETIAKGAWLGGGIKKGGLLIVRSDMDFKKAKTRLPAFDLKKVQETDFGQYIVVVIHSGVKPAGGYGIRVWKIVQTGSQIVIKVGDEEYGRGIDAATIPYHILRLRRADLKQTGEITFLLLNSDGREADKVKVNL